MTRAPRSSPVGHAREVGFEAFGTRFGLAADRPELMSAMQSLLPPGSTPRPPSDDTVCFSLSVRTGEYEVRADDAEVAVTPDLDVALGALDARIRAHVALHSPEWIFIHAAAVGWNDRAIVIPGRSFTGKTTLAAALVTAGATYYSDEYAVLDERGLVHPYPKPLSIREPGTFNGRDHPVESLGGRTGTRPLPVALIAVTRFRPEVVWRPEIRSSGEGGLALLDNAVPARERPHQVLAAIASASAGAVVLAGDRGEAADAALAVLAACGAEGERG